MTVLAKLLLLFIVVPLVELVLLLQLADWTSPALTLALVIVTGVLGSLLARAQGWRTYQRIQRELAAGRVPGQQLMDAVMIFVAGALLLTPGVLTDAFGLSLLMPVCRRWYRRLLAAWLQRHFRLQGSFTSGDWQHSFDSDQRSEVIDSYVVPPSPSDPSPGKDESPRQEAG